LTECKKTISEPKEHSWTKQRPDNHH